METKILVAGFGGQGLMSLGKIISRAAVNQAKKATFIPSYGAEMRGGTAHCLVKLSSKPIASPLVYEPDIAFIFNQPSLYKFKNKLGNCKLAILNSDFVFDRIIPAGPKFLYLPLNKMAIDFGQTKIANIIALGIMNGFNPQTLDTKAIEQAIRMTFSNKNIADINIKAFEAGRKIKDQNG